MLERFRNHPRKGSVRHKTLWMEAHDQGKNGMGRWPAPPCGREEVFRSQVDGQSEVSCQNRRSARENDRKKNCTGLATSASALIDTPFWDHLDEVAKPTCPEGRKSKLEMANADEVDEYKGLPITKGRDRAAAVTLRNPYNGKFRMFAIQNPALRKNSCVSS